MSLKKFRPDTSGMRVYCVVANDMSINELVAMTPKEFMMLKLSKGDLFTFEDWTETFNIQPKDLDILDKNPIYGVSTSNRYTYKTLMQYDTSESI